METACNKNGK